MRMKIRLFFFVLVALPAVLLSSENVHNKGTNQAETKLIAEIDRYYSKHEADFDESAKTRFKNKYNELIEFRKTKFRQFDKDLKNRNIDSKDYKKERITYLQNQEEELKVEGALLRFCCLKIKK
jgi:hypothetical protein